eukprot:EG_transcript_40212
MASDPQAQQSLNYHFVHPQFEMCCSSSAAPQRYEQRLDPDHRPAAHSKGWAGEAGPKGNHRWHPKYHTRTLPQCPGPATNPSAAWPGGWLALDIDGGYATASVIMNRCSSKSKPE